MDNVPQIRFKGFTDEWRQRKLGDVFDIYSGQTPYRGDTENFHNPTTAWIKTTDLNNASIAENEENISDKAKEKLKVMPVGTVLVAMYGGFNQIGRTGMLTYPAAINQAISALPPVDNVDSYFLITELNRRVNEWKTVAASSRKDPNITKSDIENFILKYPCHTEQVAIGNFFHILDDTIHNHQQKLNCLRKLKKGYLQQMLPQIGETVPKVRIDGFTDPWQYKSIRNFLSESRIPGTNGLTAKKLTVKLWGKGVVAKETAIEGSTNTTYFTRRSGQLIYGKLDFLNAAFGIIPDKLDGYESTIDSPAFDINSSADASFLLERFLQRSFYEFEGNLANGSRKAKRINQEDFLDMQITAPCKKEQVAIGNFFHNLDNQITIQAQKLEQLKQLKVAYLQKMFV